jgi:hypothetical protein
MASLALAVLAVACSDNKSEAPSHGRYAGAEPEPLACVPNLDGKIEASEVRAAIETPISYLVSPPGRERSVDVAGRDIGGGRRRWDFAIDYADDRIATVVPATPAGKWYAASFPADAFVVPFDAGGRVESILAQDERALWLLGLASSEPEPAEGKTLLVYGAPVELLRFPLERGVSFVSTGTLQNGTLRGLPYAGKDIYEIEVDAIGELVLPAFIFTEVHRVRTHVTVQPAVGASTSRRQVSFFFECFAEIARATSRAEEPEADFALAAELRRIGFE